jgi:phosphotriesterase-related protein
MLHTLTGAIDSQTVTIADAHAHLWIDSASGVAPEARLELNDYPAIEAELRAWCAAARLLSSDTTFVPLIVDCQPSGAGRNVARLNALARATGVHIAAATGAHQLKYYPPDAPIRTITAEAAAAFFVNELTQGMFDPNSLGYRQRATFIKIGYEGSIDGQTAVLMEASAIAARETGAAVLFHTEAGKGIEHLLPFYAARGIGAQRLYMCHVDKRPDLALHREMAQAGVLLGYDTWLRPKYDPQRNTYPLLYGMIEAGYAGSVAVGLDCALPSMWAYRGGLGISALIAQVIPRLRAEGYDEATIRLLTAQNVAQRLANPSVGSTV